MPLSVVDRSPATPPATLGRLSPASILTTLCTLVQYAQRVPRSEIVYIALASTRAGFLRDASMIWSAAALRRTVILHVHGGGFRDFHDSQPRILQFGIAHTLTRTHKIITLSERLRTQFDFLPDWRSRTTAVPYGLPPELAPEPGPSKAVDSSSPVHILYLSNMIPSKGYQEVLEACRLLRHRGDIDFQCHFYGAFRNLGVYADDSEAYCEEKRFVDAISEAGLSERVHYHGTVEGSEKIRALRGAHLFVLPTTYPWEAQPISVIEAMAYGLPVVATPHRGIVDMVSDAVNGILVDPDPAAIERAIRFIVADPSRYQAMSLAAHTSYEKRHSYAVHMDSMLNTMLQSST